MMFHYGRTMGNNLCKSQGAGKKTLTLNLAQNEVFWDISMVLDLMGIFVLSPFSLPKHQGQQYGVVPALSDILEQAEDILDYRALCSSANLTFESRAHPASHLVLTTNTQ
jgi:hypothetical protein